MRNISRWKRSVLVSCLLIVFLSTQAVPYALSDEAGFVSPAQVDLLELLAPPPSDSSPRTLAEIEELVRIQKTSTPAEKALATADGNLSVFQFASGILGPGFSAEKLPLTAKFFQHLTDGAGPIIGSVKDYWKRPRPFLTSHEVKSCFDETKGYSYPSGHSTFAYLCAIVLADIVPEKRAEIFARAAQYARARMICGVHYPSDVDAGRIAGTVIAAFALRNAAFKSEFEPVRKEIRNVLDLK